MRFPVHLAAYRQVADRAPPALVRLVALVRRALVAPVRRAELVRLQLAVRSAVAAVVARGAVEQRRSMR